MSETDKRERIVDALESLMRDGAGGTASVSDIARRAGIAKGGLYYYFRSKEEALDALVTRHCDARIEACRAAVQASSLDATGRMRLLTFQYRKAVLSPELDAMLHLPDNAAIHQRSLAAIVSGLSEVVGDIIRQGVAEGAYICAFPQETAEMVLSVLAFLLDRGLFAWQPAQLRQRLMALAALMETGLKAAAGSFDFLWQLPETMAGGSVCDEA